MQVAAPLELYDRPANLYVAGFIGSPAMNFLRGKIVGASDGTVQFQAEGSAIQIDLSGSLAAVAGSRLGLPVVLGIRPENIQESEAGSGHCLEVDLVEPMGAETFLHLRTGSHALIARMGSSIQAQIGQSINVRFDLSKAHLFDANTEEALRS